ncbi:uncharacterized protein LOC114327941 [Diabrotica virgifera virgifera]|uniref:Altered inheritance of mitochondria protein 21-like n=1 Tax=Diabrotica virgifera virgifera TaxID=50390 RepID=A0A6P7FA89_DIAVI|nr:uncharacterized protein LOC114327941 [Diabrotica virgifera virgifera]
MVRKRSKVAKRHYYSEEEPETESDFEDDPEYEPAPKKYSLRQRKRQTFNADDWEYEEDVPVETPKVASDDEEFNVTNNNPKSDEAANSEQVSDSTDKPTESPAEETVEKCDELVDFEDMIRADVVVNKNRIDYDNVIQKTEIKVQPLSETEQVIKKSKIQPPKSQPAKSQPAKPGKKRGRKPKRRKSEEEPQYFAPQIQEDENDADYHPYKPRRTRRPKKRPAGEIDSSLLEDFDNDDDLEDTNDRDYNPEDDLDYPGLSNFILNRQITDDFEDTTSNTVVSKEGSLPEAYSSVDTTTADTTDSVANIDLVSGSSDLGNTQSGAASEVIENESQIEKATNTPDSEKDASETVAVSVSAADTTSAVQVPDTTDKEKPFDLIAANNGSCSREESNDAPLQLDEINESDKNNSLQNVSSTSSDSVIKVNENCVSTDLQVNGSVKHVEDLVVEADSVIDDDEDDDDVVFVEQEKKYEIIVLDD